MTTLAIVLIAIGIVLLIVEIFIPGFGIAGGLGIVAIIVGIVISARNLTEGLIMFLILLIVLSIMFTVLIRYVLKNSKKNTLILEDHVHEYHDESDSLKFFIGKEGVALTPLRPAGHVDFDGVQLDVVTQGGFIAKGTQVVVTEVQGTRIIVRQVR